MEESVRRAFVPLRLGARARRDARGVVLLMLGFVVSGGSPTLALDGSRPADTVLLNGEILLFEGVEQLGPGGPPPAPPKFAQALAITEGRIAWIGTTTEARPHIGPGTKVVDLGGRMVMPGIIDGHFHGTRGDRLPPGVRGRHGAADPGPAPGVPGSRRPGGPQEDGHAIRGDLLLRRGHRAAGHPTHPIRPGPFGHHAAGPRTQRRRAQILDEQPGDR